jgi:hypothetical protein
MRVKRAKRGSAGAASTRARKSPGKSRRREPSEEAAGQAAAIIDHDGRGEPASDAGLVWNHSIF